MLEKNNFDLLLGFILNGDLSSFKENYNKISNLSYKSNLLIRNACMKNYNIFMFLLQECNISPHIEDDFLMRWSILNKNIKNIKLLIKCGFDLSRDNKVSLAIKTNKTFFIKEFIDCKVLSLKDINKYIKESIESKNEESFEFFTSLKVEKKLSKNLKKAPKRKIKI